MTPSIRGSMKNEIICENRPLFNSLLLTPSFLKIAYLSLLSLVSDNSLMESIALPVIKKMIPIVDGVYSRVNINPDDTDTDDVKKYKDLLNKEYSFCLKVIDEVIGRANKLYDKQMATGKVVKFCCDFKALEEVADK